MELKARRNDLRARAGFDQPLPDYGSQLSGVRSLRQQAHNKRSSQGSISGHLCPSPPEKSRVSTTQTASPAAEGPACDKKKTEELERDSPTHPY